MDSIGQTHPVEYASEMLADLMAIKSLVTSYFRRVDHPDNLAVASLFAEDGVLSLGSLEIAGRENIASFFVERNRQQAESGRLTRHISGDIEIGKADGAYMTGYSCVAVYAGTGNPPLPASAPSTICDFFDTYIKTEHGWLFQRRRAEVIYAGPGAAGFVKRAP